MTIQETQLLNDRLDKHDAKLDLVCESITGIADTLTRQVVTCECARAEYSRLRALVEGNGQPSLDHRITTLETARSVGKWVIVTSVAVGGAIAACAQAIAQWLRA